MELWYTEEHTENARFGIKIKEQLYSAKSDFQQIDVFDSYEFGKILTLDGLMMVNEKDEWVYHEMIAHVPMAANPEIKRVLVIGGGDGGTVRELVRYKNIESIDFVEIDEMVVEACRRFIPQTASALDDPRVNHHYVDGIAYVKTKNNHYDLILVDSTDPIGPGEGLFTYEFYNDCYQALTANGILVNQSESPYYDRDRKAFTKAHAKIKEVFPVATCYQFHMPTYPSGHWLFGFASKGIHPYKDIDAQAWTALNIATKYYNTDIHQGAFMLPNFVKELANNA